MGNRECILPCGSNECLDEENLFRPYRMVKIDNPSYIDDGRAYQCRPCFAAGLPLDGDDDELSGNSGQSDIGLDDDAKEIP